MDGSRATAAPPRPSFPYPEDSSPEHPPPVPARSLADRASPERLLLGAGAAAVLGSVLSVFTVGTPAGVVAVSALLVVAAGIAVLALRAAGPAAGESLALLSVAAAATLVVVGASTDPRPQLVAGTLALFVAVGTGALWLVAPQLRTWPVASWGAAQVVVLVVVTADVLPRVLLPGALLGTALAGLALAWFGDGTGHGVVSHAGLLGAVPWWAVGVWVVADRAWSGDGPVLASVLGVGAALGLLLTTHDRVPDLPVGAAAVPVLAGATAGVVLAGAASSAGPWWLVGAGFLGLALAAVVAVAAARGPDWVPRDAGLTAATSLTLLAAFGLAQAGWEGWVGLLLLVAAPPSILLAARSRDSRPAAVPVAVATTALGIVLLASDAPVSGAVVGSALVAVAVAALAEAVALAVVVPWRTARRVQDWVRGRIRAAGRPDDPVQDVRAAFADADTGRTEPSVELPVFVPAPRDERAARAATTTGTAVGLIGVAMAASADRPGVTAGLLAVLGLASVAHGDLVRGPWSHRAAGTRGRGTLVLGQAYLVAAAWVSAELADLGVLDVVPVVAGVVLLAGNWRALPHRPSWGAWGPGLAVALLPAVLLAGLDQVPVRQVAVLVASLVLVLGGLRWSVRAPFLLGLAGVLGVTGGWVADRAPTPWVVALYGGGALLVARAAWRERQVRGQQSGEQRVPVDDRVPTRVRGLR